MAQNKPSCFYWSNYPGLDIKRLRSEKKGEILPVRVFDVITAVNKRGVSGLCHCACNNVSIARRVRAVCFSICLLCFTFRFLRGA